MPIATIETLDDPLLFDRQANFNGGQVSHDRASDLGPDQAWIAQDVDLETNGALRTRMGWHALGDLATTTGAVAVQGAWWFDTPTIECLLVVAGGKLYKGIANGTWTKVADSATGSATATAYGCQIADVFFCGTGADRPKFWPSANIATPAAGTAVTDGPAKLTLLTGHTYRLFGVNADTPDEVYCTGYLPNTGTPFGAIMSFRVGEGEGDPITALVPWKGSNLIVFKAGWAYAVNTSTISLSDVTTLTADFSVTRISKRVGCIAPKSPAVAGNDLLFLARDGVRSLARTQADGDGAVSLPLSEPIKDIIERINLSYVHLACGAWWRGRYMLAVPLDSATSPNVVLVMNLRTGGWFVWTGLQAVEFVTSEFNTQQARACVLDARRQLLVFRDHVQPANRVVNDYADTLNGSTYTRPPWKVRTRSMSFQEADNPKQARTVELTFDQSEALIDLKAIRDDDEYSPDTVASKVATGSPTLRIPFTLPSTLGESRRRHVQYDLTGIETCRSVAFEVTEANGMTTAEAAESGPLGLSSLMATGWINAIGTGG